MKQAIESVFGGGGRTVLDVGVRRVTERGIERGDGALVAGLALAPTDLESLDRGQVAALNSSMAGFLAGLEAPIQLLVSNSRFDSERYLLRTIDRWRGDWLTKAGLRERMVSGPAEESSWAAFVNAAAAKRNLRQIKVRIMLPAPRGRGKRRADPDVQIERIGAALDQAGIEWRAMSGLELVLELERGFFHGGGVLANALEAGGPVRLVEGLENLAFDLADPLPEWMEFAPRHMRFPHGDGERFCAAGYIRALPRAVKPGWLALPSRFDFDMTLSLHIDPLPDGEVMRRVAQSERQIAGALEDAADADPVAAREQRWRAEDVGALADAMRDRERYFKLGGYYLIGAGDREELDKHRRTLRSVLAGIGLGRVERIRLPAADAAFGPSRWRTNGWSGGAGSPAPRWPPPTRAAGAEDPTPAAGCWPPAAGTRVPARRSCSTRSPAFMRIRTWRSWARAGRARRTWRGRSPTAPGCPGPKWR